jgi:predicted dehydrogenase
MAKSTYRAGIVGLGFIGAADQVSGDALGQQVNDLDGTHLGALSKHPRVDLVAGSSRDAGRRERFAARTSLPTYADWQELIEKENLDIVSVATYAPVHAQITVACAEAGIRAIYCEKPIATRLADAERMVSACDQAGALLAINHNRRFQLNHRRLRERIAQGDLGELTSASMQWSAGRLGNVGTHMFDAIRMVTSREVRAVSGTLDLAGKPDCRGPEFSDPGGWGVMRLDGNFMATVDAMDYAKVPASTIVNGTSGRAILNGDEITLEYWDGTQDHWPDQRHEVSGMDRAVAEIVDALDDKTPFPYPGVEGLRTLEAIVAFHASHARNAAWTELPLAGADRDIEVNSG